MTKFLIFIFLQTSGGGLSPIDDSDLNGVPPGLQRDCGVDEMGKRVQSNCCEHLFYNRLHFY